MGSPNIDDKLKDDKAARDAVQKASNAAMEKLNNTIEQGKEFINNETKGIVEVMSENSLYYSKFSEDFSLDALDGIIDSTINVVADGVKVAATEGADPELAAETAKDVGELVKGMLSLAATSSTTQSKAEIIFSTIVSGEDNFAVYYACSSTSVDADNAWGHKDIIVISNTYVVARVNPNPDITRAQMLQKDLDTLRKLNDKYDDAQLDANSQEQVDALQFRQNQMATLKEKIDLKIKALT